ncbi:hypothetical protein [Providencia sp. PROV255]|uniref:hypothetical protein n=1 Tax=Providencia sp. PROV255 TaxID=2949943 RepID=UPI002348FF5C|nr:hypothetical protein [Providencia sp. PROV255]
MLYIVNIPTHIIALNLGDKTKQHIRIAFSLCLPASIPHREQNKNKIAPIRFVYIPTFPDRKQSPQKNKPGHPEFIPDTVVPDESPRVA